MEVKSIVYNTFSQIMQADRQSIFYILFYTLLEGILVLSIPLTSSFVINSLIAHSYISIVTLGIIISIIFVLIVFLRLLQEYIIEKFEQKVFVREGLDIGGKAVTSRDIDHNIQIKKLMNYFFDITTIQKIFPVLIFNGAGLLIQILLTLLLLFVFSMELFFGALLLITVNIVLIIFFGKNGIKHAIERSDTKHETIYYLQQIPHTQTEPQKVNEKLESHMDAYIDARENHFKIRVKQLGISFLMQGVMIAGFFILGGYLVINGSMPVGDFVASEIIVVTLIYTMNSFVKQLDYVYESIEGFYKVGKLSTKLDLLCKGKHHEF